MCYILGARYGGDATTPIVVSSASVCMCVLASGGIVSFTLPLWPTYQRWYAYAITDVGAEWSTEERTGAR